MSLLSMQTIFDLASKGMIEPFKEDNINGPSYILTLGRNFTLLEGEIAAISPGSVGKDTFKDVFQGDGSFILLPGKMCLNLVEESVSLPSFISAHITGTYSWTTLGLIVHVGGLLEPGHEGQLVIQLYNAGPRALALYPGSDIARLIFHRVE